MRTRFGQYITFKVEDSNDARFSGFTYFAATKTTRTVRQICKAREHPEDARYVANINGIRNVDSKLRLGRQVRVPDRERTKLEFNVLAGDEPPRVVQGYPKIQVIDRSERAGLSVFTGYDPARLEVPVRFEKLDPDEKIFMHADGTEVEDRISKLEQMAGRGQFSGAAVGQPSIVRVTTTAGDDKTMVPLIPLAYQRYTDNPSGPVYWIAEIDWDDKAIRNHRGQRIRQLAVITLVQYVAPRIDIASAAERHKAALPKGTGRHDPNRPHIATGVGRVPTR